MDNKPLSISKLLKFNIAFIIIINTTNIGLVAILYNYESVRNIIYIIVNFKRIMPNHSTSSSYNQPQLNKLQLFE